MSWRINILLFLVGLTFGCETTDQSGHHRVDYASPESLVEVEDVIKAESNWKLIDLRKPEEFKQGHIRGAQNVWRTDITDTSYQYGGMMPTQLHMEQLLSGLGISPSDTIIIYDQKAECDAARLWWILKFYGHQHVRLLNGGLAAWKASGYELVTNQILGEVSNYRFQSKPDSTLLALFTLIQSIDTTTRMLLDTRGKEEYSGKFHKNGAAYPGHIDGAVNLDWAMAVDYDGSQKFLSIDSLKARYATIGIDGTKPVITYCHSGVRSAHTLFVLTELLGYRNIKNYDGSWIEWSHVNSRR